MNDLQEATQQFLERIRTGKIKEAYQSTTQEFQNGGSLEDFQNFLKNTGLLKVTQILFDSVEQNGDVAGLKGTFILADKERIPIVIYAKQENHEWKIHNITPAIENSSGITLPDQYALLTIIHKYLMLFISALQQEDFTVFYNDLAELWKVETNPLELKKTFQNFMEKNIDLSFVVNATPVISEQPVIDENGFVTVKGYYPSANQNLLFQLTLCYQHPDWKLLSIKISTNDVQ